MRQLPEDPADWTDDDVAFARNWDINFAPQLAQYAALKREPSATVVVDPTPSQEVAEAAAVVLEDPDPADREQEDPALGLPWLAPTPRDDEQSADDSEDSYDHWKRNELKAEAERREPPVTLTEGVDSRARQPWIDALRDDDRRRMSGQD